MLLMIDDFVKRPQSGADKPDEEDFFPDLSQAETDARIEETPVQPAPIEKLDAEDEEATDETPVDETIEFDNEKNEEIPPKKPEEQPDKESGKEPKKRWWHKLSDWFMHLSKKQKIILVAALILILFGIGAGAYKLLQNDAPIAKKNSSKQEKPAEPTTVASTLTGRQVEPEINQRHVTGVMIENSTDARPQAGLQEAGVVFEAIAEAGITRFLALYQDTDPENIGPVRSARPYYLDWLMGFDASYAHVGGSPTALENIRSLGIKDLDQSFNPNYYQRVSDRFAPHNVFTSIDQLRKLEQSKGYTSSEFIGFDRKKESKPKQNTETPPANSAKNIAINISSNLYNSSYVYQVESNSYLRSMAGAPHNDANGQQINPKVVVALVIPYSKNGIYSVYGTLDGGQAFIFQDGVVTTANWQKASKEGQIAFTDDAGKKIALNPGQTWITAISNSGQVTHQP